MKVVVPMAGRGSRFAVIADTNPEYQKPKPLINVKGKPMVAWAVESLKPLNIKPANLIFICLQEHEKEHQVTKALNDIFGNEIEIILIPAITRGAVETVLNAKHLIDTDEDMIVSDSDHYFDGTNLGEMIRNSRNEVAGIIPVFRPPDKEPKWSYTLFDSNFVASAVGEKDAELAAKGAYANIGAYYFSKGKYFVEEAENAINSNEMYGPQGKQEFYVAPMYQRLLDRGLKVKAAVIPEVWGLGTPKDLEYFLANYKG